MSGVRIAHGSQSVMAGTTALSQRFWVREAASSPREQATMPLQRKLKIHALASGGSRFQGCFRLAFADFLMGGGVGGWAARHTNG